MRKPVQGYSRRIVLFWLLVSLSLGLAWHEPVIIFFLRQRSVTVAQPVGESQTFAVLVYGPVGRDGGIPLERLKEHIATLEAAGFSPINLREVRDLLFDGKPLPERAVLLTFDHPAAQSWWPLRQSIRASGWRAVAFVGTARSRGAARPAWRFLRMARREGRWDIGATDLLRPDTSRSRGGAVNSFTHREWLPELNRAETVYEYQDRILARQLDLVNTLTRRVQLRPIAFAYPDGSYGQHGTAGTLENLIRLGWVGRYFYLGFAAGPLAYNSEHSDALRLNRLRVDPAWSGHDLLTQLAREVGRLPLQKNSAGDWVSASWIHDRGAVEILDDVMEIAASQEGPPARMWIAGSERFQDGELEIVIRPKRGSVILWLRTTPDDEHGHHLRWCDAGEWELFSREMGQTRLLAQASHARLASQTYRLHVFFRGGLLQAEIDGEPLFERPVRVADVGPSGLIGIGVEPAASENGARLQIASVNLQPTVQRAAVWNGEVPAAAAISALHRHAHRYTIYSPPGPESSRTAEQVALEHSIFRQLAEWYGAVLMPQSAAAATRGVADDEKGEPLATVTEALEMPSGMVEQLLYEELRPDPRRSEFRAQRRRIRRWADAGHEAMRTGRYEDAILYFSDWHTAEPGNAAPLNYIADALTQLDFRHEAVEFLVQSLSVDPSQTVRLGHLVRLLDALNRDEEARLLLNRHALLFPDDPDVRLAQVEWLLRQERALEARERLVRTLQKRPDHLASALQLLRIAVRADEHVIAMRAINQASRNSAHHAAIVAAVRDDDLLTIPEARLLYELLDRIEQETDDPDLRAAIRSTRPRTSGVHEVYANRPLSEMWHVDGASVRVNSDGLTLRASPERSDFVMRLLGSHIWQDSYVEATILPGQGNIWISARQAQDQWIRFGYSESSGQLLLQRWQTRDGFREITADRVINWQSDGEAVTLRLHVRGRGAVAYVQGEPVWSTPMRLPGNVRGGRVSLGGESELAGQATWRLQEVSAGPLGARIASILPASGEDVDAEQMRRLQQVQPLLTDVSPAWFARDRDGVWTSRISESDSLYRVFAQYHGLRFMPSATLDTPHEVTAAELRSLIEVHELDGLLLVMDTLPAPGWFDRFQQQAEARALNLIFVSISATNETGKLVGVGPAQSLQLGSRDPVDVMRRSWNNTENGSPYESMPWIINLDDED